MKNGRTNIYGPAYGFLNILEHCGAECDIVGETINIIHTASKECVPLVGGCSVLFKRSISQFCEYHLLNQLSARVNAEDGDRKDMIGITMRMDYHATLGAHPRAAHKCLRAFASQISDANLHKYGCGRSCAALAKVFNHNSGRSL